MAREQCGTVGVNVIVIHVASSFTFLTLTPSSLITSNSSNDSVRSGSYENIMIENKENI